MSIKLQGSAAFEPEFVGQLSMIARTLLEAGLDPAALTISKNGAARADAPEIGAFQFDYTVSTGEEQFTVTEPNDARFLDDLMARLHDSAAAHAGDAPPQGLFARVARWMAPSQ